MYISGLPNDPFFGDGLYATPDEMDAEITEIDANAMQTIACDALQGDALEADRSQGDAMEANAIYADPSDGDVYDTEDVDAEASESVSQDSTGQTSSEIEAGDPEIFPTVFIKHFPFGRPGALITAPDHSAATRSDVPGHGHSIWAPFSSQRDWEIARWAKTHRVTSSAFSDFLACHEVCEFV